MNTSPAHYLECKTLRDLKQIGYTELTVKEELRRNLINALKVGENPFKGIHGYDDTVLPDLQKAILSRHNILLLGLRGQAKTRIARLLTELLDEYIPIIRGSEINDSPFHPISKYSKDKLAEQGDDVAIEWVHRSTRYAEKLATPDVTVADLIGDVDPIKAATLKLPYSDERVIHFGLIPRSHRSIFVINELPDLQARIQVSLFNILQEEDVQIRGFKLSLPLDILFVFTANPEDYTNRGAIVTPLKDRIDSQILTHYPKDIETSKHITMQEARLTPEQRETVISHPLIDTLIEQVAFEARKSEYIDAKSGVSARLTIAARELLFSNAERRMLINNEPNAYVNFSDFYGVMPAITGKVELVYEGEQEGPAKVAAIVIGKAIKSLFLEYFPDPEKEKKSDSEKSTYRAITDWFAKQKSLDLLVNAPYDSYKQALDSISGLRELVTKLHPGLSVSEQYLFMEFCLHGMAEFSLLGKFRLERGIEFKDMLSSLFSFSNSPEDYEEEE